MTDIIGAILATLTMLWSFAAHPPARATCPHGFWLSTGIRRDGRYACTRVPVGDDVRGPDGIVRDRSVVPAGEIRGRIGCTGGAVPIVIDERTVGCQRGWER